eukprot:414105-Pyramimonas_sp.AAC.1
MTRLAPSGVLQEAGVGLVLAPLLHPRGVHRDALRRHGGVRHEGPPRASDGKAVRQAQGIRRRRQVLSAITTHTLDQSHSRSITLPINHPRDERSPPRPAGPEPHTDNPPPPIPPDPP